MRPCMYATQRPRSGQQMHPASWDWLHVHLAGKLNGLSYEW